MANKKLEQLLNNANEKAINAASQELSTSKSSAKKAKKESKTITAATEESKAAESKTTKETKSKKEKKSLIADVSAQQNAALVEQVVTKREVKYKYPADAVTAEDKKRWRQKVRNKMHDLEMDMLRIKDQNSKEYKAAKKKFEEYRQEVLKEAAY